MAGEIFPSLANILAPHGPPVGAKLMSFVPGDYSIHFFLQLALIVLACRGVGWFCDKYLAQPQVVARFAMHFFRPYPRLSSRGARPREQRRARQ